MELPQTSFERALALGAAFSRTAHWSCVRLFLRLCCLAGRFTTGAAASGGPWAAACMAVLVLKRRRIAIAPTLTDKLLIAPTDQSHYFVLSPRVFVVCIERYMVVVVVLPEVSGKPQP